MNDSRNKHLPQIGSRPATDASAGQLEQRIGAAIEQKPVPFIPADFAAKVAARAAALPQRRRAASVPVGRSLAWASTVLLAFALFVLAPHATPRLSSFSFDAEILALVELAVLGWGLARSATRADF